MAALQSIRSKGPLLVIVIGLALFAFIAGDAWKVIAPHQSQTVGEVNGETLNAQDYQSMVEEFSEALKVANGSSNFTEAENNQIKDQVWTNYLNEKLIGKQAEKLGLTVTTEEVQYLLDEGTYSLLQNTPFVNATTGAFDKDMMNMFLANYTQMTANPTAYTSDMISYYQQIYTYWNFIQKNMAKSRLMEKYQYLITKSLLSNPVEAENYYNSRNKQSDMLLAGVPYSAVSDDDYKVIMGDVESYLKEHKEEFFQEEETRDIRYIDVQVTASQEDRDALENEMMEYTQQLRDGQSDYAAFIRQTGSSVPFTDLYYTVSGLPTDVQSRLDSVAVNDVFGPYYNAADNTLTSFRTLAKTNMPDSVQFRQIQVTGETQARVTELSDSIYQAIKGGADFAEVAALYGQTGEPQWISSLNYQGASIDGDNVRYIDAITTSPKGELVSLPLSQATIILQVTDQADKQDKYKVAVVKRDIEFSKDTYNKAYNDFSEFVAANGTLDKMVENAEEAGYRLYTSSGIYASNHNIGSIQGSHDALKWAFSAKEGEASSLYECGESDRLMMVGLEKINKKGYRSAKDIQDEVYSTILNAKKADKLVADINAAGGGLDAVSKIAGAETDTIKRVNFAAATYVSKMLSSEPKLSAWASVGEAGQVSAPIKGQGGVYVLKTLNSNMAESTYDEKQEMENLTNTYSSIVANQFLSDLYLKAGVKDTRYLYF